MELVKALEQLSLEVKNNINARNLAKEGKHGELRITGDSDRHQSQFDQTSLSYVNLKKQLQDFELSISTLFAQISDLSSLNRKYQDETYTAKPEYSQSKLNLLGSSQDSMVLSETKSKRSFGSNGSSSHEDDSDCSSQRSAPSLGTRYPVDTARHVNPFVNDLLNLGDLNAITGRMKIISSILTIGNEIETIYLRFNNKDSIFKNTNESYIRNLCEKFKSLQACEQHINNLPTITHYDSICNHLIDILDNTANNDLIVDNERNQQPLYTTPTISSRNHMLIPIDKNIVDDDMSIEEGNGDINSDSGDDFVSNSEDVAFLNCDQRRFDNWTDNKIYMDHQ